MPGIARTAAIARRTAAFALLCLSAYASRPAYDMAFVAMVLLPLGLFVLWVGFRVLTAWSKARTPSPAKNPFETEERLARVAALLPVVLPAAMSALSPGELYWPWLVLALVTSSWVPSADPFYGAVRRALAAFAGSFGALISITGTFYWGQLAQIPLGILPSSATPLDWALWAHCLIWLWFGGTEAWEAITLYRATADDDHKRAPSEPPAEGHA